MTASRPFSRLLLLCMLLCARFLPAQVVLTAPPPQDSNWVREHYEKFEYQIPMRDGVKLWTAVYVPRDRTVKYPLLMKRTPYSCSPYGITRYPQNLGPDMRFAHAGFIFVYQDVRGKFMSEGEYMNVRPLLDADTKKKNKKATDESTDTWDTVDWLLKNVEGHNGRVGIYGISYPGHYAAAAAVDAHPAVKAVSPQAPVSNWYIGDDFHHNGCFFLPHAFNFMSSFDKPRPVPSPEWREGIRHGTPDGYNFFLNMGPLRNSNELYFHHELKFWDEVFAHPDYDDWWKARSLQDHMDRVQTNTMVVGGFYDAENCYGALKIYEAIEKRNPGIRNTLVMGPWFHGGWERGEGKSLGDIQFGSNTSWYFQQEVELRFFNAYLKGEGRDELPEALVFMSGRNAWKQYPQWPPAQMNPRRLYFYGQGGLGWEGPTRPEMFDEYVSDPANPVPFMSTIQIGMPREYMVADQRHAATRPDVLVYQTPVLTDDVALCGPLRVHLRASTTGTDCDFVVKLIDVYPDTASNPNPNPTNAQMGGYQMLVRGEPFRVRYRNGFDKPQSAIAGEVMTLDFEMPAVCHAFLKGHRIMVQVQSTWFPLVDRNPQQYVDIYSCGPEDFHKATQRVYHAPGVESWLELPVVE